MLVWVSSLMAPTTMTLEELPDVLQEVRISRCQDIPSDKENPVPVFELDAKSGRLIVYALLCSLGAALSVPYVAQCWRLPVTIRLASISAS